MRRYDLFPWTNRWYRDLFGDDIYCPETSSWTLRGQWVDLDKFEVTPRPEYKKRLIEKKETEIKELQNRQDELKKEIDGLKD